MPRKQAAPGRSGRQQKKKKKKKEEGKRARKRPGAPASSSAPTPSDSTGRIQTFMASEFYSEDGGDGGVEHAIADPWLEERVGELASVAGQLAHTTSLVVQIVAADPNILQNPTSKSPENGTNAVNCFFERILRAVARAATSRVPPGHPLLRGAFRGAPQPAEEAATALLNANEGRWREAVADTAEGIGGYGVYLFLIPELRSQVRQELREPFMRMAAEASDDLRKFLLKAVGIVGGKTVKGDAVRRSTTKLIDLLFRRGRVLPPGRRAAVAACLDSSISGAAKRKLVNYLVRVYEDFDVAGVVGEDPGAGAPPPNPLLSPIPTARAPTPALPPLTMPPLTHSPLADDGKFTTQRVVLQLRWRRAIGLANEAVRGIWAATNDAGRDLLHLILGPTALHRAAAEGAAADGNAEAEDDTISAALHTELERHMGKRRFAKMRAPAPIHSLRRFFVILNKTLVHSPSPPAPPPAQPAAHTAPRSSSRRSTGSGSSRRRVVMAARRWMMLLPPMWSWC